MLCKSILSGLFIISNLTAPGSAKIKKLVLVNNITTSIYNEVYETDNEDNSYPVQRFVGNGMSYQDEPVEIGATIKYEDDNVTVYKDIYVLIDGQKIRLKSWNSSNHSYLDLFCKLLNPERASVINMSTAWAKGLALRLTGFQPPEISLYEQNGALKASVFEDPKGSIWRVKTMTCSKAPRRSVVF